MVTMEMKIWTTMRAKDIMMRMISWTSHVWM